VSLLDNEPFKVICQLGLVTTNDNSHRLEMKSNGSISCKSDNKSQELRMLTNRAYPGWEPKQCLEMAGFHFIQGVHSSTTCEGETIVAGESTGTSSGP